MSKRISILYQQHMKVYQQVTVDGLTQTKWPVGCEGGQTSQLTLQR